MPLCKLGLKQLPVQRSQTGRHLNRDQRGRELQVLTRTPLQTSTSLARLAGPDMNSAVERVFENSHRLESLSACQKRKRIWRRQAQHTFPPGRQPKRLSAALKKPAFALTRSASRPGRAVPGPRKTLEPVFEIRLRISSKERRPSPMPGKRPNTNSRTGLGHLKPVTKKTTRFPGRPRFSRRAQTLFSSPSCSWERGRDRHLLMARISWRPASIGLKGG